MGRNSRQPRKEADAGFVQSGLAKKSSQKPHIIWPDLFINDPGRFGVNAKLLRCLDKRRYKRFQ
jgi:hypothetical protein